MISVDRIVYHIISCHIISYHIISYHIMWYHIISYHIEVTIHTNSTSYHIDYITLHHIYDFIACFILNDINYTVNTMLYDIMQKQSQHIKYRYI